MTDRPQQQQQQQQQQNYYININIIKAQQQIVLLSRRTILNRTYGAHKKTTWYIFRHFYQQYLVLFSTRYGLT